MQILPRPQNPHQVYVLRKRIAYTYIALCAVLGTAALALTIIAKVAA